jgi:feruloyl esterase
MMPGVAHCAGGAGPDDVDWVSSIANWVENGHAPDRVIARKLSRDGTVTRQRPLCPHPQKAEYTGRGSTEEAASFVCR